MDELESTQHYDYDTLNRLITARLTDSQDWPGSLSEVTTSYQYDDLGNRQSHSYRDASAIAYGPDKSHHMTA